MQHKAPRLALMITLAFGILVALLLPAHAVTSRLTGRAFVDDDGSPCRVRAPSGYVELGDYSPIVTTTSTTVYRGHIEGTIQS